MTVICFAVKDRVPDPKDPVEAEKSGMPCIMVSAVGESPRATPSTSTPLKPNGLSDTSVPDFRTPPSENLTYYNIHKLHYAKPTQFDEIFRNCNLPSKNSSNCNFIISCQVPNHVNLTRYFQTAILTEKFVKLGLITSMALLERTSTWRGQIQ